MRYILIGQIDIKFVFLMHGQTETYLQRKHISGLYGKNRHMLSKLQAIVLELHTNLQSN
jgi:hypothetical protein